MMAEHMSWHDFEFRRYIIRKMETVVIEGKKNIPMPVLEEMESNIFQKSITREQYMELTAKLLLTLRELKPERPDQIGWNQSRAKDIPSLFQIQTTPPSGSKSSGVQNRRPESIWENPSFLNRDRVSGGSGRFEDGRDYKLINQIYPTPFSSIVKSPLEMPRNGGLDNYFRDRPRDPLTEAERYRREDNRDSFRRDRPREERSRDLMDRSREQRDDRRPSFPNDRPRPLLDIPSSSLRRSPPLSRLSGAGKKKLRRLSERGVPYEKARKMIEEEREKRLQQQRPVSARPRPSPPPSKNGLNKGASNPKRPLPKYTSSTNVKPGAKRVQPGKSDPKKPLPKNASRNVKPASKTGGGDNKEKRTGHWTAGAARRKTSPPPPKVAPKKETPAPKRPLSKDTTSRNGEPAAKKIQPGKTVSSAPPTKVEKVEDFEIGIADQEFPGVILDKERLQILQKAIMAAVEDLPDSGPQVRFKGCTYLTGVLLLHCADKPTRDWLVDNLELLRPWENVKLKALTDKADIKTYIYTVDVDDDIKGTQLAQETVLTRLKKMNHGLLTENWSVLGCERKKSSSVYKLSIDKDSYKVLSDKLKFRPYFGFGQVVFRSVSQPKE